MKLRSYWRSSCSWRVRIVLAHKGIPHELVAVNLLTNEQSDKGSPMSQVPVLETDGLVLHQSVAIMEYLEETHPSPAMLPSSPADRAAVRAFVETINSGIQPLQNLSVGRYVKSTYNADEKAFHAHFISKGLKALEETVHPGPYCFGSTVTLADACLVPQLYGARRFGVDVPRQLAAVEAALLALPAFQSSHPDHHPGATI